MKTPGKKVGITLVTVASLVTIIIVISSLKDNFVKQEKVVEKELSVEVKNQDSTKDTDGDGLTDWEEELWGTDINYSDSDGDDTEDGAEVATGRNPKIAGPDDKITSLSEEMENYETLEIDQNSLTADVAKTLFTNFVNLRNEGEIPKGTSEEMAKQIIAQTDEIIKLSNKYTVNNLILFDSSDKEKLKEYGNSVPRILIEGLKTSIQDSPTTDNALDPVSTSISQISNKLAQIPVPRELAEVHVSLINDLNNQSILFSTLGKSDNDPVLAILLLPKIEKNSQSQSLSTERIANYMRENGIIFEVGDYGLLLYNK